MRFLGRPVNSPPVCSSEHAANAVEKTAKNLHGVVLALTMGAARKSWTP